MVFSHNLKLNYTIMTRFISHNLKLNLKLMTDLSAQSTHTP